MLVPHLCPMAKVKKVMFVFILEILDRDQSGLSGSGSFFAMPTVLLKPHCTHCNKPTAPPPSTAPLAPPLPSPAPIPTITTASVPTPPPQSTHPRAPGNRVVVTSPLGDQGRIMESQAVLPGPSLLVEVIPLPMDKSTDDDPFASMCVNVKPPPPPPPPGPLPFFPHLYIDDHLWLFLT